MFETNDFTATNNPFVSVVIPVYNAQRFLQDAIVSVLGQTFKNFEIILVNDGSTDESLPIMQNIQQTDNRIRIISQKNGGLPKALNAGIAAARAELIARMDGDDIMLPQRLERQVQFIEQHPEVSVVSCNAYTISTSGKRVGKTEDFLNLTTAEVSLEFAKKGGIIWCLHPGALIRKNALTAVGGYDERWTVGEDVDLWNRLADKQFATVVMPEFLMEYRVHGKTITNKSFSGSWNLFNCMILNIERRRNNEPEVSYEDYVKNKRSWNLYRKLKDKRKQLGALLTRNAECNHAEGNMLNFTLNTVGSFALRPRVTYRTLKNLSNHKH